MPFTAVMRMLPPPTLAPCTVTDRPDASHRRMRAVLGWAPSSSTVSMETARPAASASSGARRMRSSSGAMPMMPAMMALSVPWPL